MAIEDETENEMDFASAMELFFRPPHAGRIEGWVSTLFLCRKELQDCLIGTVVEESRLLTHEHHRLFATAMVTLSGIELLAQIAATPSVSTKRSRMFTEFVVNYSKDTPLALNHHEAEVLLNFRNALSHTFGLYHLGKEGTVVPMWLVDQNAEAPVVRSRGDGYEVCIDSLVELFLHTINSYRTAVETVEHLRPNFLNKVMTYGRIHVRGPHIVSL